MAWVTVDFERLAVLIEKQLSGFVAVICCKYCMICQSDMHTHTHTHTHTHVLCRVDLVSRRHPPRRLKIPAKLGGSTSMEGVV